MLAPIPDDSLDKSGSHDRAARYTAARISLERTGVSITTRHALEFSVAHAQARDAVHASLGVTSLLAALRARGLAAVAVRSAASNRAEYLRRPDLGRTLAPACKRLLAANRDLPLTLASVPSMPSHPMGESSIGQANDRRSRAQPATTLTLILADGLSALGTERHALAVLDALLPLFGIAGLGAPDPFKPWQFTPIVIAEQARVALGDEIGAALRADACIMLIGERPGLSSPDSLGAYLTWAPRPGRTDAERNCVSNIRTEGLDYATAAAKIAWYIKQGRCLGLTGVTLRESDAALLP
jgi:ethanolamine ammonia-lyase small subunit